MSSQLESFVERQSLYLLLLGPQSAPLTSSARLQSQSWRSHSLSTAYCCVIAIAESASTGRNSDYSSLASASRNLRARWALNCSKDPRLHQRFQIQLQLVFCLSSCLLARPSSRPECNCHPHICSSSEAACEFWIHLPHTVRGRGLPFLGCHVLCHSQLSV